MFINLIGFNISWFGLVYWGNDFIPIAFILLIAHLFFQSKNYKELILILLISVIGIGVDSFLQKINIFIFPETSHIPFWLMMLWACFAATVCHSLRFLASSKYLQAIIGGIFSPLSYLAGQQFLAVDFGYSTLETYLILSVLWAGLFVLFFHLKSMIIKVEVNDV
jgi:hypothetical protein